MVKTELSNYDSYDELTDEDVKSPKKAKTEPKLEAVSPDTKIKRPRAVNGGRAWNKEEEEAFLDVLGDIIGSNVNQAIKEHPILASRKMSGCLNHWHSMRRKLETTLLGAPTIDKNGKKLPTTKQEVKDRYGQAGGCQEASSHEGAVQA